MEKKFKGKAIYNPRGKAAEYGKWACNFYVGCSNSCTYCYLKKGIGAKVLGGNVPKLKACFKDEAHAMDIFWEELKANFIMMKQSGLFFSFTTDPLLAETYKMTFKALNYCESWKIKAKVLTKSIYCIDEFLWGGFGKSMVSIGFTLTNNDINEPGASPHTERVKALKKLHDAGYKTFVSLEPIISFSKAKAIIQETLMWTDLYKIGLESGKFYGKQDAQTFVEWLSDMLPEWAMPKIYIKESIRKLIKYENFELGENFVDADYNLFNS